MPIQYDPNLPIYPQKIGTGGYEPNERSGIIGTVVGPGGIPETGGKEPVPTSVISNATETPSLTTTGNSAVQYDQSLPQYPGSTKYIAPTLTDPSAKLGELKPAESYFDPAKASSWSQANNMLKEGSGLIESAQADAMKTMNARGGMNSTMAATAGTKAAIDKVTPFALQDASLYGDMGKADQAVTNQSLINNQTGQIEQNRAANNAEIAGALQQQAFGNTVSLEGFKGGIQKQLSKMQLDTAERIALANNISSQTNTLMSNIGSLLNNPDIEMNDNVIAHMSDFMYSAIEGISSLFNLDISVT